MKIFTPKQITTLTFALALSASAQLTAQTAFMKVVAADGSGDYTTVQAAVDAAPKDGTRTLIFIRDGFYKEQIDIPQGAVISLIGESQDGTVLSHDLSHTTDGGIYEDASETSTLYIDGLDFYGDNFTTQNTVGPSGGQAECFTVASDRATLRHVNLKANQDGVRFFTESRSYLKDCYIEGTVDYVYDSGIAFIDDCVIKQLRGGYITAPGNCYAAVPRTTASKLVGQARIFGLGIFFRGCRLVYDADKVSENSSYLGRNWGKTNCAAYFLNCYMDKHIKPEGWQKMSDTPENAIYLGEYGSMDLDGNPVDVSQRVSWAMTEDPDHKQPSQYIDKRVVDNIFAMDFVFAFANEQRDNKLGDFDPLPLVEPAAAPSSFTAKGGQLSWTASDGVAGYVIYKNGAYLANVTETSYTDATGTDADRYTLRTVTPTGCLGAEVNGTATGLCHVTADDLKIYTTRYGVSWNRTATATLYSVSGEALVSRTGMSIDWGRQPKGVYILRLAFADGTSLTRKVVKK